MLRVPGKSSFGAWAYEPVETKLATETRGATLLQLYGMSEVGILRSKSESSDSLWVKVGGEGVETRVVNGLLEIKIFVLALLVGFEVISKVPATLHTPLMSGANSIHGVVLVGVVILSSFVDGPLGYILTFVAAAFGAANVVGGYAVTDRMLQMFKKRPVPASPKGDSA